MNTTSTSTSTSIQIQSTSDQNTMHQTISNDDSEISPVPDHDDDASTIKPAELSYLSHPIATPNPSLSGQNWNGISSIHNDHDTFSNHSNHNINMSMNRNSSFASITTQDTPNDDSDDVTPNENGAESPQSSSSSNSNPNSSPNLSLNTTQSQSHNSHHHRSHNTSSLHYNKEEISHQITFNLIKNGSQASQALYRWIATLKSNNDQPLTQNLIERVQSNSIGYEQINDS